MADSRNLVTIVSIAVALLAVGWGVYVTRERQSADSDRLEAPRDARPAAADARTSSAHNGAGPASALASEPAAPTRGAAVAVITAEARTERLSSPLTALGTARANEAVEVTSKTSNIVTAVRFRDGEQVRKGQVLVELDSAQARADLAAAEAARADSASQVKRSRELLATRVISDAQFEQLEATLKTNEARVDAARARLDDTVIRAPFAGRVGLRRVSVGTLVSPGTTIATLDDSSLIKVDFAVPENFLSVLREGLKVYALSAAFPDREFEGTIAGVDSRVDPVSRSVTVRAVVPNPDGQLKPGMFLNVRVAPDARDALMIPEAALMPEQSRQFLYVVKDGRAIRREVRIGRREPGRVEVVAGLAPGERVIVEGTQKVREGGPVRELAREQAPQPVEARR
ncbi:MAG TPA: efflux RND transporter periplasmic adaptor subunit [Steroidobacteraceae bacterium]|nr:efflux RND transporter periplasmic adaptor subunit [Steroidobacteraceae bacterium]